MAQEINVLSTCLFSAIRFFDRKHRNSKSNPFSSILQPVLKTMDTSPKSANRLKTEGQVQTWRQRGGVPAINSTSYLFLPSIYPLFIDYSQLSYSPQSLSLGFYRRFSWLRWDYAKKSSLFIVTWVFKKGGRVRI